MTRSIGHIVRRTALLALGLLAVGVVAVLALTRTEVGRDALRQQIEARFDERFAGTLRIGALEGNLLRTIYASDVRLTDEEGRTVLHIDSVVARPSWWGLLSRELSVRSVDLFEPQLRLVRSASGTWNLRQALARETPAGARASLRLRSTTVRVHDGRLVTENHGPPPRRVAQGWLFDYADTHVRAINGRAEVSWTPDGRRRIAVRSLSAALPEQQAQLALARGTLTLEQGLLPLHDVALRAGETTLAGTLRLTRRPDAAPVLDLTLAPSRLDNALLRRLVPRHPLTGTLSAQAHVHGPPSDLTGERLRLAHGEAHMEVSGAVRGLPEAAAFELTLAESRFSAQDVRAVWPEAPLRRLDPFGHVRLSGQAEGRLALGRTAGVRPFRLDADLRAATDSAGTLDGTVALRRASSRPLRYAADLEARGLVLSEMAPGPVRLSGTLRASGRGTAAEALTGTLDLHLRESLLSGHPVDALTLEADADSGQVDGSVRMLQNGGWLHAAAFVTLGSRTADGRPAYWMRATARELEAGALLGLDAVTTRLNGAVEAEGRGFTWDALSGRLVATLDSSSVTRRDTTTRWLPPQRATLRLAAPRVAARSDSLPRLRLTSDALDLTVATAGASDVLRAAGRLWAGALGQAARRTLDKPYAARRADPADTTAPLLTADAGERERLRRLLRQHEPLDLSAELTLRRPHVLAALWPALDSLGSDLTASLTLEADADRLQAEARLRGDSLRTASVRARAVAVDLNVQAALDSAATDPLALRLRVAADSARIGGRAAFVAPVAQVHLDGRRGTLTARSEARGAAGPFSLRAAVDLLPDRNRLTLQQASLAAGSYVWQNRSPATVDVYSDAVHVADLRLTSPAEAPGTRQEARLYGPLSAAPTDTLFAEAEAVRLRPVSDLAGRRRPIGGLFNGRLSLTGGPERPELTGRASVERLSYDDRLLGRLEVQSRYLPGSPRVALEATLRPSVLPAPGLTPTRNRLRAEGTFQLPGLSAGAPAGMLDLAVDVERADLFFFEYIFTDVIGRAEGHLTGRGAVRGTFRRPVFEADLEAVGAHVVVPQFNLAYDVGGGVHVGRDAITLEDVTLTDPTGGTAAVEGALRFNEYAYFSFDLAAELDELQIIDVASSRALPFYGTIWASGPATLEGPLDRATLRAPLVSTTPESELFLPVTDKSGGTETGFLIFADSTGRLPDLRQASRRSNILDERPAGERSFLDGLEVEMNILAASGSTVHLVFDPLLGDVINAVGSGRIQLLRQGGELSTYGTFEVQSGDYLFTAGEVFFRRFQIDQGTITWDGPPANARLNLTASYRTRASTAGLDLSVPEGARIPLIVRLHITERVEQPAVDLSLAIDRSRRAFMEDFSTTAVETLLNRSGREAEYATSVLLTNTFLLTTREGESLGSTGNRLAFNSVSQLVASQLNRYLSAALPGVDVNFGVQGEDPQDLDVIYGVALRLLDERLIIRGEGVVADQQQAERQGLEGEFVVEVRLSPSVSVEAFYRREGSILSDQALTSTTGAGLSYETRFPTWRRLLERLFGWLRPGDERAEAPDAPATAESGD